MTSTLWPATSMLPAMTPRTGLTVDDLIRLPALQLRVIAGRAGLSRRVAWAHVSELEDPTPWLLGAELIMTTGIGVPPSAMRQRAYLERLDDAGVAGLALSAKLHVPPLHPAFIEAADVRGFPVLEVPLPVPFIAVAQTVAAAVSADLAEGLSAQLQVFGSLRWLTDEGLAVPELFSRLRALSGYDLYLCTPEGGPLLAEVPAPPPALATLIPASADAPPSVPGGYVLPIPAPGGPAGFLLALERPGVTAGGLAVVQHVATVAALQLTVVRHDQATIRREGAETFAELLSGVLDGATAGPDGRSRSISSDVDRVVFDVLRGLADVVLVGAGTARTEGYGPLAAKPEFAARRLAAGQWPAPALALVTRSGKLPDHPDLFTGPDAAWVVTCSTADVDALRGVAGERLLVAGEDDVDPVLAVAQLAARGMRRVLLEGGPTLLARTVAAGRVDELCLTWTPLLAGGESARVAHGEVAGLRTSNAHLVECEGTLLSRWYVRR